MWILFFRSKLKRQKISPICTSSGLTTPPQLISTILSADHVDISFKDDVAVILDFAFKSPDVSFRHIRIHRTSSKCIPDVLYIF
jgi:hypothetical protein